MLQKLDVIRVERLQSAWALELQSPRFSHNRGMPLPRILELAETIHQRPVRAFLWRLFHAHDDKITACRFWDYVCSREMAFLPAVGFFCELAIGSVNDCASSTEAKIAGRNAVRISSRELARTKIFTKRFIEGLILGDDPLAKSRSDLANLLHCLRRNPAITDIDQGFHLDQSILNLVDNWKIKLRHSL